VARGGQIDLESQTILGVEGLAAERALHLSVALTVHVQSDILALDRGVVDHLARHHEERQRGSERGDEARDDGRTASRPGRRDARHHALLLVAADRAEGRAALVQPGFAARAPFGVRLVGVAPAAGEQLGACEVRRAALVSRGGKGAQRIHLFAFPEPPDRKRAEPGEQVGDGALRDAEDLRGVVVAHDGTPSARTD